MWTAEEKSGLLCGDPPCVVSVSVYGASPEGTCQRPREGPESLPLMQGSGITDAQLLRMHSGSGYPSLRTHALPNGQHLKTQIPVVLCAGSPRHPCPRYLGFSFLPARLFSPPPLVEILGLSPWISRGCGPPANSQARTSTFSTREPGFKKGLLRPRLAKPYLPKTEGSNGSVKGHDRVRWLYLVLGVPPRRKRDRILHQHVNQT